MGEWKWRTPCGRSDHFDSKGWEMAATFWEWTHHSCLQVSRSTHSHSHSYLVICYRLRWAKRTTAAPFTDACNIGSSYSYNFYLVNINFFLDIQWRSGSEWNFLCIVLSTGTFEDWTGRWCVSGHQGHANSSAGTGEDGGKSLAILNTVNLMCVYIYIFFFFSPSLFWCLRIYHNLPCGGGQWSPDHDFLLFFSRENINSSITPSRITCQRLMTMQTSSLENVVKRFAREKGYVKLEELRKQIRRTKAS